MGVTWIRWEYPVAQAPTATPGTATSSPVPRAEFLFTSTGMFTRIGMVNANTAYTGSETDGCYVPAHHSDYYLYLGPRPPSISTVPATLRTRNPPRGVAVYKLGVEKPVLRL